jgi:putative spermidine/putrescine transport system ATP-binding protein
MQLEIKRLHSELGVTMIYVTHDQEEALTMSDRIMLMNGGRIEQIGTPNAIYFTPDTLFAADFIGQSNLVPATVVDGGTVRLHCGLHVPAKTNGHAAADAVTLLLRPEDVVLTAGRTDAGLTGTLRDTVFLGGVMKHVVALEGGGELIAQELTGVRERLASGTPVTATWRRCQILSGHLAPSGTA